MRVFVGPPGRRWMALLAAFLFTAAAPLVAHELERTLVTLTLDRDGAFVLDVANDPTWLLMRLAPFAGQSGPTTTDPAARDRQLATLGDVFADRLVLFVDNAEIRAQSVEYIPPRPQTPADNFPPLATFRLHGRMPADAHVLRWFYGIVIDPYPLTIKRTDGRAVIEWIGGANWSDTIDLTGQFVQPTPWQIALQYLALGYTHILPKGIDHILFVLGLLLLSTRLAPILKQVTTFTIAHSITLALTMYGLVSLPSRIVEPLIALSIAYVAVENLITTELKPWRLALVFSFGLLHGMGFAGVLSEVGLPRSQFLVALLTFNLGVEGGQLTVIAAAFLCIVWYQQRDWYRRRVVVPASLLIAGIGLYWTVTRAMQ